MRSSGFHAANGDVLEETYVGSGPIVPTGDLLCADTAATFVGGTGRFEEASGSALEHGCWPATPPGPAVSDLRITSIGAIDLGDDS